MIGDLVARFLIGGLMVSGFAVLGDVFKPRTFAGLFGAAPSVAMATLALAFHANGAGYAALEGRSMIVGAIAMGIYSVACAWVVTVHKISPWFGAIALWCVWAAPAFLLKKALGLE